MSCPRAPPIPQTSAGCHLADLVPQNRLSPRLAQRLPSPRMLPAPNPPCSWACARCPGVRGRPSSWALFPAEVSQVQTQQRGGGGWRSATHTGATGLRARFLLHRSARPCPHGLCSRNGKNERQMQPAWLGISCAPRFTRAGSLCPAPPPPGPPSLRGLRGSRGEAVGLHYAYQVLERTHLLPSLIQGRAEGCGLPESRGKTALCLPASAHAVHGHGAGRGRRSFLPVLPRACGVTLLSQGAGPRAARGFPRTRRAGPGRSCRQGG